MASPKTRPSVSYSFVMRLTYPNRIGMFAKLTQTIGKAATSARWTLLIPTPNA